jgi:hypothetical protein
VAGGTFVDFTGLAGILVFFQMSPPANKVNFLKIKMVANKRCFKAKKIKKNFKTNSLTSYY